MFKSIVVHSRLHDVGVSPHYCPQMKFGVRSCFYTCLSFCSHWGGGLPPEANPSPQMQAPLDAVPLPPDADPPLDADPPPWQAYLFSNFFPSKDVSTGLKPEHSNFKSGALTNYFAERQALMRNLSAEKLTCFTGTRGASVPCDNEARWTLHVAEPNVGSLLCRDNSVTPFTNIAW